MGLDQIGSELEGGNICPTLILYISPWILGIALGASLCSARRLLGTMAQNHGALFPGLVTKGAMAPGSKASLSLALVRHTSPTRRVRSVQFQPGIGWCGCSVPSDPWGPLHPVPKVFEPSVFAWWKERLL